MTRKLLVDSRCTAARIGDVYWRVNSLRLSALTVGVLLFAPYMAGAEEPKGCDAFKWPLKQEAERIQAGERSVAPVDGSAAADTTVYELKLLPLPNANLPQPPERMPKMDPSTAGYVRFAAPKAAGSYQVAISQGAWIDILQDGRYVKPTAFSGATDCPGIRKSIRFQLMAAPFVVQISGTTAPSVALLVETVRP